jgi:capsule biosynthesis protein GfcC
VRRAAWWLGVWLCLWALPLCAQQASITVAATGLVGRPGPAVYPPDARLSNVALAAQPDPDAYLLGAAWLQPALMRDQLRLKAGVVFELGVIRRKSIGGKNIDLAEGAASFQAWLSTLPITGRRTGVELDPHRLDVTPEDNWPVHEGDRLFYPRRPADVRVVGAVRHACRLPLVALQDARRYLAGCPASGAADPDMIYVVQPDGKVFAQNIAAWNRDAPRPLAPGAWIYVPFDRKAISGAVDNDFNQGVADFLATQLLDGEVQ